MGQNLGLNLLNAQKSCYTSQLCEQTIFKGMLLWWHSAVASGASFKSSHWQFNEHSKRNRVTV